MVIKVIFQLNIKNIKVGSIGLFKFNPKKGLDLTLNPSNIDLIFKKKFDKGLYIFPDLDSIDYDSEAWFFREQEELMSDFKAYRDIEDEKMNKHDDNEKRIIAKHLSGKGLTLDLYNLLKKKCRYNKRIYDIMLTYVDPFLKFENSISKVSGNFNILKSNLNIRKMLKPKQKKKCIAMQKYLNDFLKFEKKNLKQKSNIFNSKCIF